MPAPSSDLVFQQVPLVGSPTHLVFGDDDSVVLEPVTVEVTATLSSGLSVSAIAALPIRVDVVAVLLNSLIVSAAVTYDNRVTPWKDFRAAAPHDVAVQKLPQHEGSWGTSEAKRGGNEMPWTKAVNRLPEYREAYQPARAVRQRADAGWQLAMQHEQSTASAHQKGSPRAAGGAYLWQTGDSRRAESTSGMQTGIFHVLDRAAQWQRASSMRRSFDGPIGASLFRIGKQFVNLPWQMAGVPVPGISTVPPVVVPPEVWNADLLFECPPLTGFPLHLVFGSHPCEPEIPGDTVIVPVRRVYIVINEASLRRVDGNIALPTFNMSFNIDADSWTWSFSAALPGSVLSDLEPATSGAPVEVEAMINGVAYRALVERIGRDRSFGKSSIRVQGRGKTALLDSPYAPVQSFFNEDARTAQQLMADVLTVNGVPMDWTVNWGLEDWLVPANVFSHQGSYISALNAIATAAGGYIQPHASLQTISVLPRYQSAPWDWGSVVPDFELPSDVTTREGIEWVEKARYNRVFISGQQSGILGQVTRAGTAGDLLAPIVTDALITTAAAARQRGLSVLANTGRQADVSLGLPVLAETGVITPGKFVRYTDAGAVRLGVVRSTAIEVGMPEIWQNLGVETHA